MDHNNRIPPIADIVLKVKEHKLLTPFEELQYLTKIKGLAEDEALKLIAKPKKNESNNKVQQR